jgi:3-oxoadipate enol-lactonase
MPDSTSGYAPSGDARIAYETAGAGQPVIFIHAGIADRRMWRSQLAEVPPGFRYVSLDLRGHGATALTEERFSNHEDVLAVMDHLDIDSAVVVGCSMGGGTAFDVALVAPDRVSGLAVIGTGAPGFDVDEYEPPQWPEVLKAYEAGDVARVAELDAEIWVIGYGRSRDEVDPEVMDTMIEMDLVILPMEDRRDELLIPLDPPRAERWSEIAAPTLVMVGEHDLPNCRQSAELLAGALSHHDPIVVPRAAHLPSMEQPEDFNRALVGFLQGISA